MAYDLEEQEQLATLKGWWKQYGNLVSWVVIAALSAILVVSMVDFAKSLAPSGPGPDSPPSPPPAPQPIPPVQQPSLSPDQLASAMAGALASVVASARR